VSEENREPSVSEGENKPDPEPENGAEAGPAPEPKKKKAKAAASESVKDRNQRIREEAAARRRNRREQERQRAAPARNLDASEIVDDALARGTHNLGLLLRKHFNKIQWAAALIVVGGIGYKIYDVRRERTVGENSDKLLAAVAAERARVGEGEAKPDAYSGLEDTRKTFATEEARLKAAADAYKTAAATGGTTATLARLGEAGILYDQGKYKEALKAYQDVRGSELAGKDEDVKGRAIEGIGLSHEGLGELDAALKSFRELENSGITGFAPLGQFHQARLLRAKGENDKAKELIKKVVDKLAEKDKDRAPGMPPSYLQSAARELYAELDPEAAAAATMPQTIDPAVLEKISKETGKSGGVDPEKLKELLKQVKDATGSTPEESPAPQEAPAPEPAAPASAP